MGYRSIIKKGLQMTTFTTQDRQDAQRDGVSLNNIAHPCASELNPDSLETIEIELPDRRLTIDQLDNIFGICALNTMYTFTADQLHEFARAIERAHGIGE